MMHALTPQLIALNALSFGTLLFIGRVRQCSAVGMLVTLLLKVKLLDKAMLHAADNQNNTNHVSWF